MASFQDILKTKAKDIQRPDPYPQGTYLAVVTGLPKEGEVGTPSMKVLDFVLTFLAPQEDVDTAQVAEWQKKFGELKGKTIRHRIFIENKEGETNLWRVKQFLTEHLGVEEGPNDALDKLINESQNRQVLVKIGHKPASDGSQVYPEVNGTFAV